MAALVRARRATPAGQRAGRLQPAEGDRRAGDRRAGGVQVGEMQRSRLLAAAVGVVEELGWQQATVGSICARARISRRTFYDLFANRDECLLAAFDGALARIEVELREAGSEGEAGSGGGPWRERVRGGLWRILCFFDREPLYARLCLVHSASGGPRAVERREQVIRRLALVIAEGASAKGASARGGREAGSAGSGGLLAEGLVGAVVSILQSRLRDPARCEPLSGLLGELMGLIVLPYLGERVARRERVRALPALAAVASSDGVGAALGVYSGVGAAGLAGDRSRAIPMRLTYRTARVLEDVAEHPGVSNRTLAERVGISDQGQISKLLARLARLGLLVNNSQGQTKGLPNAWSLTDDGLRVLQSIHGHGRLTA